MLFMVAAMAAEMERYLIRERTLDGLRTAETQGRRGGRPPAVGEDVLAAARARQSRGESVTAIARHLKIGRSTLYRGWAVPSYSRTTIPGPLPGMRSTTVRRRRCRPPYHGWGLSLGEMFRVTRSQASRLGTNVFDRRLAVGTGRACAQP
jgi:hypothetical protein